MSSNPKREEIGRVADHLVWVWVGQLRSCWEESTSRTGEKKSCGVIGRGMMMRFYLTSTERPWSFGPVCCELVSREKNSIRDDLAVVFVTPSIPAHEYSTPADLDLLVLASRHQGHSIFEPGGWPLAVYICSWPSGHRPDFNRVAVLGWGEIHQTREAALESQLHWQSSETGAGLQSSSQKRMLTSYDSASDTLKKR